jgi:hypothetical protein
MENGRGWQMGRVFLRLAEIKNGKKMANAMALKSDLVVI